AALEVFMRINVSVFFASFLVGCSTVPSTKSTGVSEQFKEYGCEIDNDHFTQDREYVETGLKCVKKVSDEFAISNSCIWIEPYYRLDDTYVSAHYRCDLSEQTSYLAIKPKSTLPKSKSGSRCHYVSGHFRKGKYVKGYTRCK
ncbi:hypothetical protein M2G70_24255, partial [Vibrio vulnificus]|nr:hypothetical protein [Vibrio vulnificus]